MSIAYGHVSKKVFRPIIAEEIFKKTKVYFSQGDFYKVNN